MTQGALFAGIDAFGFAGEKLGIRTAWQIEIDPYNLELLQQNFSGVVQMPDVRKAQNLPYVDVVTAGFPCQDTSSANYQGEGVEGPRSGLWREALRIVREVGPRYVVLENSPDVLHRGWERIVSAFQEIGFCIEWECLSAYAFGASHLRERLFAIAYSAEFGYRAIFDRLPMDAEVYRRQFGPESLDLPALFGRIERYRNSPVLRKSDGVPYRFHRIKGLGNSIYTPICTEILTAIQTDYNHRAEKILPTA